MSRGFYHAAAVALMVGAVACGEAAKQPAPQTDDTAPEEKAGSPESPNKAEETMICADDGRCWRKLVFDGLHNPANEALTFLQEPGVALMTLPPGGPTGNKVDWVAALREGYIAPRTNLRPETKVRVLDLDIVFSDTAGQLHVVFPHRAHTEWLDCSNCHPDIFKAARGANEFGMLDVLQGKYCGRCHGAVAFPLTECRRCHSRPRRNKEAAK